MRKINSGSGCFMARDCAIGCPGKVRKSLSYLYSSFLGLDVVLMGSDLYLKPRRVCVRKQHGFQSGICAGLPSPRVSLMGC